MVSRKIFFICLAGLAVNLGGSSISRFFELPIYLDTVGTVFIASLGGYVPGIAVGFFTNLIKARFFDPQDMYFCSVSVAVAIITTFFARKGTCDSFRKILLLIPVLTVVASAGDMMIDGFLRLAQVIEPIDEIETNYGANFMLELLDKCLSVLTTFILLKFTSSDTKKIFQLLGQKQAPLSKEIKRAIDKENYLSSSLRTKMLLILAFSSLLVSISIAIISYLLFKSVTIDERIHTVDGIASVVISEINPALVDDFIAHGRAAAGYIETEQRLYAIKNSNINIKYLYVYKISPDGCHVVFDMDTGLISANKPGQIVDFDPDMEKYRNDLLKGKPVLPIITNNEFGHLLTMYKPLYDSSGKCKCYVAIDFSMETLTEYTNTFIIKLLTLFIGCFVFIFAIGLTFVENNIILPVNTMAHCARNFSYDSEKDRLKNIEMIKQLQIKTGDEIENLYSALIRTTENLLRYLEHLQIAKDRVSNMHAEVVKMEEIAHTDSLTGVKNKTAYTEKISEINEQIAFGVAEFCIVMVDVNFLKRVNDTYGHERGNEYLINACKLLCAIFGAENVYRIGGDEFVVIIDGEKVYLCKYFASQLTSYMDRKKNNATLKPWEKISAAFGISYYKTGDRTAEEVFKRADALMYANKIAMKAART